MSLDRSTESLNSPSKDFIPFASYKWSRSNTVRKVNSTPTYSREEVLKRTSVDDIEVSARRVLDNLNVEHGSNSEKLRKYLSENTYRQSLESISEYKTKKSFARPPSSSFESLSSDCTDYVLKTATLADANNKSTILSESSSYLSWIESLNSENFTAEATTFTTDGKAGEWNNFWLNYNNARNLYLQQQNSCSCNSISENNADGEELLDASSIQKEPSVEHPSDLFYMTRADMMETVKCCQKIIEILQMAMNKTADNTVRSADSSYVGQHQQNRSSLSVDSSQRYSVPNMQKQKYNPQNKSNLPQTGSCINALFNSGVTDILKKVILKRRDSSETQADGAGISKTIFPNWSGNNLR